ncbi:hypothetical protein HanRHA438_Chr01g0026661 [Helianthus annuus]|nr:hypothetical protein HanRHA438_Chr01g0026661 [Helianthus annuus]
MSRRNPPATAVDFSGTRYPAAHYHLSFSITVIKPTTRNIITFTFFVRRQSSTSVHRTPEPS